MKHNERRKKEESSQSDMGLESTGFLPAG